jgi:phosphatidylinositol 4-kinase B
MADLQARLVRTKHQWTARLDDYFSRRMDPYPNSTFGVLLQLFAYQDVLGNGLLDACGESLNPYVPQLLSFLLHGAYDNTLALEEWLLQQCSENVFFAHRCVWFLRAWCLQVSPAPATANNMTPSSSVGSLSRSASSATSLYALDDHSSSTRYAPHERDSVKGLLFRVIERGQLPARQLQLAEGWSATTIANTMMTEQYQDGNTATTAAAPAVQDIVVPIDINGYPNKPHVDSIAATEKFGLLPVHAAKEQAETTDVFMSTPNFLDSLMTMADGLFLVPRERRTEELRIQLQAIELEYLPSNAIYMPVNRVHHWTWRIVAEDSIAISTKERVPCIVILEVVDYNPPPKKNARRRGLLDSFRKDSEELSPATMSLPPVSHDISERDMVQMWRTSARNPYRHSSLLDKVTNFTQDSLKRFRDKNPRDALFWSGDHHIMDLMKPLTRATSFTRDDSREILSTPPGTPVSPYKQPTIPTTAMGQWSSPVASVTPMRRTQRQRDTRKKADDHNDNEEEDAMDALIRIRNNSQRREESQPYGSTAPPRDRKVRPPPVVFKESWETKQERIRKISAYGSHPNWRLLPILIKSNDDLRQEQLASQLIYAMASILAKDRVPVWLCPYEIVALSNRGGIIEAIPDTISIASLKKNDSTYTTLAQFFLDHFDEGEDREDAKANFVESLAAYSIVCFILQIKDRHNGNILLDTCGHLIHIDFGFFFLSSPGKNSGFESAPFKLTREFVEVMDGPTSLKFRTFRELCCRTFLSLRKHCLEIILLVEMLSAGNEELACFRGRPEDAVQGLRERFRLDLNDRACQEYVNALIDESLENWRTRWYDRYQRFCVGVL